MNCQEIRAYLQAFGDGELEAAAHRTVQAHLQQCPACRAEYDARRRLVTGLQEALVEETRAPVGLAAAVSQEIARSSRPGFGLALRRVTKMRSFKIAFSTAGVLAAVLVAIWMFAGQDLAFAKAVDKALQGVKSAHFTAVEGDRSVEVWATPEAERVESADGWMVAKDGRAYLFDLRRKQVTVTKGAVAHLKLLRSMNVLLLSERLRGRVKGKPTVTKETITRADGTKVIRISGRAKATREGVALDYEGTMLVDPATNLILSGEARQIIPNTPQAKRLEAQGRLQPLDVTVDHVEYNGEPPAGTFDTTTPLGWTVRRG